MPNMSLDVDHLLTGIGLKPTAIQVLGHFPELNNEIRRKVYWPDFSTLLPP